VVLYTLSTPRIGIRILKLTIVPYNCLYSLLGNSFKLMLPIFYNYCLISRWLNTYRNVELHRRACTFHCGRFWL